MPRRYAVSSPVVLEPTARLLVKVPNWLGDVVMSLPALWAVRLHYPRLHLGVLVREELSSFFSATPWVDSIVSYKTAKGVAGNLSAWKLVQQLRRQSWNVGLLFPRSFESALWLYLARVPIRIGASAQARSPLLTHALRLDLKRPDRHLASSYLHLVRSSLGCALPSSPPQLIVPTEAAGFTVPLPYVTFAPGAAYGPAKQWPLPLWQALAERSIAKGMNVVLVGTMSERPVCEEIAAPFNARCQVLAGETTLPQLMSLLARSAGFVGNDSGATHLAAALGVPTVAIFGSTNPVRTAPQGSRCQVVYDPPPCSPCLQRTCRWGHYECLRRITPEVVFRTLERIANLCGTGS